MEGIVKLSNVCFQITVAAVAAFALAACPSPGPDDSHDPSGPDAGTPVGCGDKICQSNETAATCPLDCQAPGPVCGNHQCEAGETSTTCPADCAAPAVCGDNVCASSETT